MFSYTSRPPSFHTHTISLALPTKKHHVTTCTLHTQGYYITEAPYVLHYGLHFDITGGYGWDKHAYFSFDPHACPPWDFQPDVPHQGGLFPHPPMPRELTSKVCCGLGVC